MQLSAEQSRHAVQGLRVYYEGIPFAIRCGGVLAGLVAATSTGFFLARFRRRALRLRSLVHEHFDPANGYPVDLHKQLSEADMALLSGGDKLYQKKLTCAYLATRCLSLSNLVIS